MIITKQWQIHESSPPILVGIIIYFKTTVLHYVTTTCNGIVGTIISDIATMKVDLFSWMGENLTFEDNSCVLILGLGKDIQITDYRLQFIWGAMYASYKKIKFITLLYI